MDMIKLLIKKHALNLGYLFTIAVLISSCRQSASHQSQEQIEPVSKKHSLQDNLITYVDSVIHLLNAEHSDSALHTLTTKFSKILPLHLFVYGKESPDSLLSVSIHPQDHDANESLYIVIPRNLQDKFRFKAFTDHFGPEIPRDTMFDAPKDPLPVIINLKNYSKGKNNRVSLQISSTNNITDAKNHVTYISISK